MHTLLQYLQSHRAALPYTLDATLACSDKVDNAVMLMRMSAASQQAACPAGLL